MNSAAAVVTYNLRFPGQYFDAETGKHYNYFRDYDPAIGRYLQGDPIGIAGGTSLYTYVNGSPLSLVDWLGLIAMCEYWGTTYGPAYLQTTTSDKTRRKLMETITNIDFTPTLGGKRPGSGPPIKPDMDIRGYWVWRLYLLTWMIHETWKQKGTAMYYCTEVDGCSVGPWYLRTEDAGEIIVKSTSRRDWKLESQTDYVPKK